MKADLAKLHEGVWLPAGEEHLVEMIRPGVKGYIPLPDGRGTYQRHKYLAAVEFVKDRQVFVDIGGHVGLWSMQAELDFDHVIAFEPHPFHAELFRRNCPNVVLHECALGEEAGLVGLTSGPASSGDTYVSGPGDISMMPLDELRLGRVDMLKIDTEGYELPIVRGARDTLLRCKPVVVVEQKGRDALYHGGDKDAAVKYLTFLGMKPLREPISGDHILGWS